MEQFVNWTQLNSTVSAPAGPEYGWTRFVVIPVNSLVVLIGVLGNGIVVTIGVKMKQWRQVNYCYVTNLALTDILFLLVCVTFTTAIYVLPSDSTVMTDSTCKFMLGMGRVTLEATCLTLGAMAFDRYLSVVHSVRSRPFRTPLYASIISLCIWLVSFIMTAPFFHWSHFSPGEGCRESYPSAEWAKALTVCWVAVSYVLPLLSVVFCYTSIIHFVRQQSGRIRSSSGSKHRQHRVTKLTVILTLLFAICWLPVHIINLWLRLGPETFPFTESMYAIKIMAHWLSYFNSCINPIVYAFYNDKFRENCRKLLLCAPIRHVITNNDGTDETSAAPMSHVLTVTSEQLGSYSTEGNGQKNTISSDVMSGAESRHLFADT